MSMGSHEMTRKQNRPSVHIYTLSRLVHAEAGAWERRLEQIEQGRNKAYRYYQPVREAVVAFCATEGEDRDDIVSEMLVEARRQPRGRGQDPEADNLKAFETFEGDCYSKIGTFTRSLLRRPQAQGVPFEGVMLLGAPHFQVLDEEGQIRYVFLQASRWREEELKAYLELLGVIVEKGFGHSPTSILHMDLRTGLVSGHKPSIRVAKKCAAAARHYARVVRAKSWDPVSAA
jgi:hypothetical protein